MTRPAAAAAAAPGAAPGAAAVEPVRKRIVVEAPQAVAFDVFTARMGDWWPMATHHIGKAECADVRLEPRAGGRCFERGVDGSECDWGRVLAWDPPGRVVIGWELTTRWTHDPAVQSQVEVRFTALDAGRTQVDLEHRGLEVYGAEAAAMREVLGSPNGWTGILEGYARVAGAAGAA